MNTTIIIIGILGLLTLAALGYVLYRWWKKNHKPKIHMEIVVGQVSDK